MPENLLKPQPWQRGDKGSQGRDGDSGLNGLVGERGKWPLNLPTCITDKSGPLKISY